MADPIAAFFAEFQDNFTYYPSSHDWSQYQAFQALHYKLHWTQSMRTENLALLHDAWAAVAEEEFQGNQLKHYQAVLDDLGFTHPDTVEECEAELRRFNVNIVDLIQYRKDERAGLKPQRPRLFRTVGELMEYSQRNGKSFPVGQANSAVLGVLLRHG